MLLFYSSLVILLMACIFVDHRTGHQLHQEVFISEGRKVYPWRVNLEMVLIMFHSDFFGVNLFLNYHRHNVNIQAVRKVFSCFITYFDNAKFPVVFIWCDDGSRLNLQKNIHWSNHFLIVSGSNPAFRWSIYELCNYKIEINNI